MQFHSELPLVESVDVADPLAAARALVNLPHPFLLHSAATDARARWSFFGANPFAVFRGPDYDGACALWRRLAREARANDEPPTPGPFTRGRRRLRAHALRPRPQTPPPPAARC